jgi:EAL domain-containing protein (putative c-di-GMP-specific phosphodiesterase class I)
MDLRQAQLFVNIKPASSRIKARPISKRASLHARRLFTVVAEVTERAIATDLGGLPLAVNDMRRHSARVADDDMGADPLATMSLLPAAAPPSGARPTGGDTV